MDVNRIDGGKYYAPAPPVQGSGETVEYTDTVPLIEIRTPERTDTRTEERPERHEKRDSLRRAVDEINSSIAIHRRHLGIRKHEATNRRIVTVYDSDTNEVIREIPPESVLEAHANMLEMVGLFVNTRG